MGYLFDFFFLRHRTLLYIHISTIIEIYERVKTKSKHKRVVPPATSRSRAGGCSRVPPLIRPRTLILSYIMSRICSSKMNLVDTFRAFSDPSRLRILHLLLRQPLCVCHLQELLDLPQVNVSQHLAYLRKNGLVEFTRVQTWKMYRLRSPMSRAVELSLRCLAELAKSDPVLSSDLKRLPKALKNSRFSSCGDPTVDRPANSLKQSSS